MLIKNLNGLSVLPYFILRENRLHLRKELFDFPIIDMHTHLGWHYLLTRPIDLARVSETRHFFPSDIPFQLERYTAYDFTPAAKKTCEYEVVRGAFDTRGYSATHTVPNIIAEMDRLNIEQSVLLAIDYPVISRNSSEYLEAAAAGPDTKKRLPVFISLHPLQTGKERLLKKYLIQGARGIKLHPQMQLFKASHRSTHRIYELAEQYGLPILFHTGLSPISPRWQKRFVLPEDYEKVFAGFPRTTFVIGHAGGAEGYEWAAAMANRYANVFVEISGQPPRGIEYLVSHMDTERILYGSDWAFYPMAIPLAKALLGTEKHKKIRKKLFRDNALKLLKT